MKLYIVCVASMATVMASIGCGDGFDLPTPARMEKVGSGDGQRATAGNRLANPMSVLITAEDGSGVPREEVLWSITQGMGAVLSDTLAVTDGTGLAQIYLTLGPTSGEYGVQASLVRKPDAVITFTATAVAAPQLSTVTPQSFTSGDQVVLTGTGLSDSTVVEIDGVEAEVTTVSPTGLGLSAIVPHCLVPGQVPITARVGGGVGQGIQGTYVGSTEPLRLAPGEYETVQPSALGGCATFPDADTTGAEYLLAPQAVSSTPGELVTFRLKGDASATPIPLRQRQQPTVSSSDRFHGFLRDQEHERARLARRPLDVAALASAPIVFDIKVGDRRSFRVCNSVTCSQPEEFTQVRAEAKYVGDHAVIYQDVQAPASGLTDQDFSELGALFDLELYDVGTRAFGAESDVDRNGHLFILLTPVVNSLTEKAQCDVSFVTGFFFALDVDPLAAGDTRSNQAEVFYAMVPDPTGSVTCEHTRDRVKRLVPVTFIHEFQHMVNFYQHVILRASSSEETWLNEAMSHMSEEITALHFEALGDQQRFQRFAINNLFNAFLFLKEPEQHVPIFSQGVGTLEERGGSWLLLRWLADQVGDEVIRRLSETGRIGTDNLVAAAGEPLSRILPQWFLANYVSDLPGLSSVPPRLTYTTWDFRALYADLHGQNPTLFDRPFPLEPRQFTGGTFDVTGLMGTGSGAYFLVVQSAQQRGFTVELLDESGNPLSGPADPRLNIIRIR